jgi:hypothetical protein
MMHSSKDFLDRFIEDNDEVLSRCLSPETFGAELDNEENDVPLYDQFNRGLTLCQEDRPRESLQLEGGRPGTTGYIPSMEEALESYPASSPKPRTLLLNLEEMPEEELMLSQARRGLLR